MSHSSKKRNTRRSYQKKLQPRRGPLQFEQFFGLVFYGELLHALHVVIGQQSIDNAPDAFVRARFCARRIGSTVLFDAAGAQSASRPATRSVASMNSSTISYTTCLAGFT